MQLPHQPCEEVPACSNSMTSTMAGHTCRCHYYTKLAGPGFLRPPSVRGYTIQPRLYSFHNVSMTGGPWLGKVTDHLSELVRGTVYTNDKVSTIYLVTTWHYFDISIGRIAFCVRVGWVITSGKGMIFHLTTKGQIFHQRGYTILMLTVLHNRMGFEEGKNKYVEVEK